VNERRIARIQELIKARVAKVIAQDLPDPELGMVTVTRVKVDREMMMCRVFWSCLGGEREKKQNADVLKRAKSFIRKEIAAVLSTRTVPDVQFRFDESIAGAKRVDDILRKLREEREGSASPDDGADPADRETGEPGAAPGSDDEPSS